MSETNFKIEAFNKLEVYLSVEGASLTASLELPNVYEDWEINVSRAINILTTEVVTKMIAFKKMGGK